MHSFCSSRYLIGVDRKHKNWKDSYHFDYLHIYTLLHATMGQIKQMKSNEDSKYVIT